ncbi:MAG: hypothetical protein JW814_09595 [Candidatus Krumholzibacteriota bacterium]|nr:hypothetical protein [Candidatus Krumholzibacteriota bacterium]
MRIIFVIVTVAVILSPFPSCSDEGPLSAGDPGQEIAGPPVRRSEAVLVADRYARAHWTMTETNRRGITCGEYFLSEYPVGDRVGVGYKWGGWTDIDEFLARIEEGYGTGTGGYVTYEYYSFDCVVGVSCTGLVSRAWNLDEKYTLCYDDSTIENKFCEICEEIGGIDFASYQTEGLKKGDVFINDTHSILFVYETRNRRPMIIDSTSPGVRFRQLSWIWFASNGYVPIRYNNIVDDLNPAGTIINPEVIEYSELPVEIDGNTRNVVSMEFDYYSTAPAVREVGPEMIYELRLDRGSEVRIHVTEARSEGINNNLHLLSSLALDEGRMGVDCLASHDNTISRSLDSGTYYIIVDSGLDTPGEYILTVSADTD